jgi:hypothetical protein
MSSLIRQVEHTLEPLHLVRIARSNGSVRAASISTLSYRARLYSSASSPGAKEER